MPIKPNKLGLYVRSTLVDCDRILWAVCNSKTGMILKFGGNRTVNEQYRGAVFAHPKDIWRKGVTPVMALAFLGLKSH